MTRSRPGIAHASIAPARLLVTLTLLLGAWGLAQTPSTWSAYPLQALVPGTRGYGLTQTARGVERFDVEVLARQDGFGLGFPLVLIRATGGPIERAGGVAAGMSGSPVVLPLEGREYLLGAIGYTFPDTPGGLALVTPIDAMRAQAWGDGTAALPRGALRAAAEMGAVPVSTPVLVAGLGPRALALLERTFAAGRAQPVQVVGGGGGTDAAKGGTVVPGAGSAVAVQWVRGDVDVAAVGTITEVDGDRLLAFGHPVLGVGDVDWPLAPVDVTAIVPQRQVPFKLVNLRAGTLGVATVDRPAAVGGRLDAEADLLPVTLTVAYETATEALRFEVVRDERLWPSLVAVATLEGLDRVRARLGAGTATVHWDATFAVGPNLRLSETVVDDGDVTTAAARLTGAPLALLANNPFAGTRLERLALLVRVEDRRRDVEIRRATVEPGERQAGDLVPLFLRLQPWRRAGEVRTVDVRLPDDLHGRVELVVRGGTWPRDPEDTTDPDPDEAPLTFDELLAFLRERPGGGDLVVDARAEDGPWVRLDRLPLPGFVTGRVVVTLDVAAPPEDAPSEPEGDDVDDPGDPSPGERR